jgi:hypothetical protein
MFGFYKTNQYICGEKMKENKALMSALFQDMEG